MCLMIIWYFGNMVFQGVVLFLAITAVASALPTDITDNVISKLDPGLRYQYMSGSDGPELVDLWMKTSDLLSAAKFNPDVHNHYHLFTRLNPSVSQPVPMGAVSILKASNFDPNKKTVFLVHGWQNDHLSQFNVNMVHAYPIAEDVNLFMVDWSIGAGGTYVSSIINVIRSGEHVAKFITWLNSASGASLANYHIIGHSLGGHQVGVIGRNLGGEVPYITSLDPALPGWVLNPSGFKSSDGIYTEVMHTNAGFYGKVVPIGDVDFYPNGGNSMPGCSKNDCSHHRAIYYMAESLIHGGFTGYRCDSLASIETENCDPTDTLKMGGLTPKPGSSGIYLLRTSAQPPFSLG